MSLNLDVELKKVGEVPHHELMTAGVDDILVVVPEQGFKDTGEVSRQVVAALRDYAGNLGRKCGLVIIANNILAQEPESRRNYGEGITPDLFFGVTLVVSNPLARAFGNAAIRFTPMKIPTCLSESVEAGVAWLETQRNNT